MLDNFKKIKEKYDYNFISHCINATDENLKPRKQEDWAIKVAVIADEVLKNLDNNFIEDEEYSAATSISKLAKKFDIDIQSKIMKRDILSYLTVDKENIENFQTDKVIVINSGIPYKRYITFSIAYDIGALLFDFSEDKDASYSFVFREKHQKGFLFENSWSYLESRETLTHFLCYVFALFLIMPPNKFTEDCKKLDEKGITLYEKAGILADKYRTNSALVGERIKIMQLANL